MHHGLYGMLAGTDRYLAGDPVDPVQGGASYRVAALWLTDAEFAEFARARSANSALTRVGEAPAGLMQPPARQ